MSEKKLPLIFEVAGVPVQVRQGPFSLVAYVGVPLDHPLTQKPYGDIPLDCHGGITYAAQGRKGFLPEDFYWLGWDCGHSGDYSKYNEEGRLWTVEMVEAEARGAAKQLVFLMKEAADGNLV